MGKGNSSSERKYLLALATFVPFGPARIGLLKKYFGSYKNAWGASSRELVEIGLRRDTVQKFISHRDDFIIDDYLQDLEKRGIKFITIHDDNYPTALKDLPNAPVLLYIRGTLLPADENAVAIVGTRKMTMYGREVTERFASELARYGITIVSGLALGIDAAAHTAALDVDGRTIAVLGRGLDEIYPASNAQLGHHIIKSNSGAIISEYPLGYPALKNNFANRNRIISGLSKAVVVVEGEKKSGTLLTAKAAAEQGREVFAIPGAITSPMSEAPYFLIRNGAKMALSPRDIIDELDLQLMVDKQAVEKVLPGSKEEEKILDIIANESMHIDVIARKLTIPIHKISSTLTSMELKGMVKSLGDGEYGVAN